MHGSRPVFIQAFQPVKRTLKIRFIASTVVFEDTFEFITVVVINFANFSPNIFRPSIFPNQMNKVPESIESEVTCIYIERRIVVRYGFEISNFTWHRSMSPSNDLIYDYVIS